MGLDEIFWSAEHESVGLTAGDLQLTVSRHPDPPEPAGWSAQLGWHGGTDGRPSWGIELPDDRFAAAVHAAREAGVATWGEPAWVGYWSFPMRDPMGNTVEISARGESAWPPRGDVV